MVASAGSTGSVGSTTVSNGQLLLVERTTSATSQILGAWPEPAPVSP